MPKSSHIKTKPVIRFNPALLIFLVFPLFGLGILMVTGASKSTTVAPSQIAPLDTIYKPAQFVGITASDFTMKTTDGGIFHLSDWRGHIVLLTFWTTWCVSCKREMPVFQQMIDSNIPDKPIIFAIDTDPMETAYVVNKFEASLGVHILAGLDSDGIVTDLYQIVFKPRTFVIDSQGVIRYDQLGEMTLDMLRVYLFKLSPGYF